MAWQFSARTHSAREGRENTALRLTALSFFALAVFVTADAMRSLLGTERAHPSTVGIALAATSLLVMPCLSLAQRRAGRQLRSASAVADSKQELLCTYLSAVLLGGLAVNAALGWAWADPVTGLIIAGVATQEGRNAWQGHHCCTSPAEGVEHNLETSCRPGCPCCA